MKAIDQVDAQILRKLLADGRKSFATLADELQISKDLIWKRFSHMKEAGIITGATIHFNYPCFNYEGIANIFLNVQSESLPSVLEKLQNTKDILAGRAYNSKFNISILTLIKQLTDLEKIKGTLRHNPVNLFRSNLWIDVRNTPENLDFGFKQYQISANEKKVKPAHCSNTEKPLKLDDLNMQIVDQLTANGRKSFSKIAESIGTSSDTVIRRYNQLVEKNYIRTCIQIDPLCLGYKVFLVTFISFSSHSLTESGIEKLAKIPNLVHIIKIIGEFDLQLSLFLRNIDEIFEVNEKIMAIPGIASTESLLLLLPPVFPVPQEFISTF